VSQRKEFNPKLARQRARAERFKQGLWQAVVLTPATGGEVDNPLAANGCGQRSSHVFV
jgi:hypothetical protein